MKSAQYLVEEGLMFSGRGPKYSVKEVDDPFIQLQSLNVQLKREQYYFEEDTNLLLKRDYVLS